MISRGQIFWVNLDPTQGHEQARRRPVLVVSSDAINRQPLVVTVVVGTDAKNLPRDYPVNVRVTSRDTGLPMDTVFLCFQVRSLDPSRFLGPHTKHPMLAGHLAPPPNGRDRSSPPACAEPVKPGCGHDLLTDCRVGACSTRNRYKQARLLRRGSGFGLPIQDDGNG